MANKKLGLFWSKDAFSFVEVAASTITKITHVPFQAGEKKDDPDQLPEGLRLTKLLEKAFLEQQFSNRQVHLCLPTRDLIFRSFVIPWMMPDEVQGVIEFEVAKYIPIKLDELVYTYHTYSFEENKLKNLRVLFVAVRKDALDKYTGILQHTNIRIDSVEPAVVSLCRLLRLHRLITPDQTTAILDIHPQDTRIIILDKDVIQLVRESAIPCDGQKLEEFRSRLVTELRVSYNFFTRQNDQGKLRKILVVSQLDMSPLCQAIKEDFDVPVTQLAAGTLIKKFPLTDLGQLYAYGTALKESRRAVSQDFNFKIAVPEEELAGQQMKENLRRLQVPAVTAGICALLLLLVVRYANNMAAASKKKVAELTAHLGSYDAFEEKDIQKMQSEIAVKLQAYKGVRSKSDVSLFMYKIPSMLPRGMWLSSFKILYSDKVASTGKKGDAEPITQQAIELQGYVYREDANEQFQVINEFYAQLKTDSDFSAGFKNMDLKTRKEMMNQYPVSAFTIVCQ